MPAHFTFPKGCDQSFVLLHVSLSRLLVSDVPRRLPTWAPIEFYAAISAMDSVENCMELIAHSDHVLTGWRLFSTPLKAEGGEIVQFVTGFEPLLIKGEAIAYARPGEKEAFRIANQPEVLSRNQVQPELIALLGGHV